MSTYFLCGHDPPREHEQFQVGFTARTAKRPLSELEAENMRLRRELTNAKLDLDRAKKAAAYFVRESRW
jgi:hypothetical protein